MTIEAPKYSYIVEADERGATLRGTDGEHVAVVRVSRNRIADAMNLIEQKLAAAKERS